MEVLSYHETRQQLIAHTGVDPEVGSNCHAGIYQAEIKTATETERAAGQRVKDGEAVEADLQAFLSLITRASVRACHACALEPDEQVHRYEAARLALFVEQQGRVERALS